MKLALPIIMALQFAFPLVSTGREPEASWSRQPGITDGRLIAGSKSPDGKYALYEFNFWDAKTPDSATTATGIGLAPVDRSILLFVIDSRTKWMTDKEVTSFLTFLWNGDSTLVATHDSGAKHSKLSIYRISQQRAISLDMPDMIQIASAKLGVTKAAVTASGQMPTRWIRPDLLEVSVRVTTAHGKLTTKIPVLIAEDGKVSTQ
jgi:hypothetical protein